MQSGKLMNPLDKYEKVWKTIPNYGRMSPGVQLVPWITSRIKFKTVLDVGCGQGTTLIRYLLEGKKVQGIEPTQYLHDTCLKPFVYLGLVQKGVAQSLPYPESSFDLVHCTDVIEHIIESEVIKVVRELVRVAKLFLCISVCTSPAKFAPELKLHETVCPLEWWECLFDGFRIKLLAKKGGIPDGEAYIFKKY